MNTPIVTTANLWDATPGGDSFQDITQMVAVAAEALDLGDTLFMTNFTLMEAMNAIEIMDPRMDSGVTITPNSNRTPAFDPNASLSPDEVSWILDRSIAAEMGWHMGRSFSQTVHTWLYIHNLQQIAPERYQPSSNRGFPLELVSAVLRSATISLLKTCDLVWRELTKSPVYDAEDYHSDKFDVSLCENLQVSKVMELLDASLDWLDLRSNDPSYDGLSKRLRLRKLVLEIISKPKEGLDAHTPRIETAISLLTDIRGQALPEPDTVSPARLAFDPTISRRLVSTTPLRVVDLPDQEEAWDYFRAMLEGLFEVYMIRECPSTVTWLNFLIFKGRYFPSPERSAFIRSITPIPPQVLNLVHVEMTFIAPEYLSALATAAGVVLHESGYLEDATVLPNGLRDALARLQELLQYTFSSLNQNRARSRRHFAKTLWAWHKLHEDTIQVSSMMRYAADMPLAIQVTQRLPLVIYHLRLSVMVEHIFSGFELELYEPSECPFTYWHAGKILFEQKNVLRQLLELVGDRTNVVYQDSVRYLTSQMSFVDALQKMSMASFWHLTTTADSTDPEVTLKPRLDTHRQRINAERRCDWSNPPPDESTTLRDVGRPAWDEYEISMIRHRRADPEQSKAQELNLWVEARFILLDLRRVPEGVTRTELCSALYQDFLSGLLRTCNRRITQLRGQEYDMDSEASDYTGPLANGQSGDKHHPWFPELVQ